MENLACRMIFGEAQGERIQAQVEKYTGQVCPCRRGLQCLLLDANGWSPLLPEHDVPGQRQPEIKAS